MPENPYNSVTEPWNIPDELKVPDGEHLLLQAYGRGVQKYVCKASATIGTSSLFSQVTHIQRLYTDGDQAPKSGCDQAHDQAEVLVEYSAHYFFYCLPIEEQ